MLSLSDLGVVKQRKILSSGVPLLLLHRENMPISISFTFWSGSRFNPLDKEGLAHFVEHMIVAGSEHFPTKDKIAYYIEQVGGSFGASTGPEDIQVSFTVADSTDFYRIAALSDQMINHSLFNSKTIETERGSILRELSAKRSNPRATLGDLEMQHFLQGTLLGRTNLGSEDNITSINMNDLKDYYHNYFTAERLSIVVSGGISLEETADQLEKVLTFRHSQKPSFTEKQPITCTSPIASVKFAQNDEVHFSFGFRICSYGHKDLVPLNLLKDIIARGRTSRLTKKLRYEKGLVYGVSASSFSGSDAGFWKISSSTSSEHLQEVLDIVCAELRNIVRGDITEDELEFAKARVLKTSRIGLQTSGSWVSYYSSLESTGLSDVYGFEEYQKMVSLVKKEDLVEVAKRYFESGKWYLAMTGSVNEDIIKIDY